MMRIVFWVIGDRTHGMGHVIRSLVLAERLRGRGAEIVFVTPGGTPGHTRIARDRWPVVFAPEADPAPILGLLAGAFDMLIIDVEHGPDADLLRHVRPHYLRIVVIGGVGFALSDPDALNSRLVDLQICQSILINGASRNVLSGLSYLVIDPRYLACRPDYVRGKVVVTMGGSDPHGLTEVALAGLSDAMDSRWVAAITGPARGGLSGELEMDFSGRLRVAHAPDSLRTYLDGSALCICTLGMTAYESLCSGVPVLLTSWSRDHERTAAELERLGVAGRLGLWSEVTPERVRQSAAALLARPEQLARMGRLGRELVDGQGAERTAAAIAGIV